MYVFQDCHAHLLLIHEHILTGEEHESLSIISLFQGIAGREEDTLLTPSKKEVIQNLCLLLQTQ